MRAAGEDVCAHKPVVTGLDEPLVLGVGEVAWPADHELLAAAAGRDEGDVAPLRYGAATSPKLAAELCGERIEPADVIERARCARADARARADAIVVVEGVGGLLVPFCEDFAVCDLAAALALPVLIAARPGLGTINHTLLTLAAARSAGLHVSAVILTPWPPAPSELERSNRAEIERIADVEVAVLRRVRGPDLAELERAGRWLPWRRWLGERDRRLAREPSRRVAGADVASLPTAPAPR
jgi:dethiobiotin synthetase